jgi:hypothetical protein
MVGRISRIRTSANLTILSLGRSLTVSPPTAHRFTASPLLGHRRASTRSQRIGLSWFPCVPWVVALVARERCKKVLTVPSFEP